MDPETAPFYLASFLLPSSARDAYARYAHHNVLRLENTSLSGPF